VDGQPVAVPDLGSDRPRSEALKAAIGRKLAAAEARRRGLVQDGELAARLAALRREAAAREEALLGEALFAQLRDGLELSETEVRAHYERTKARHIERQLRFRRRRFENEAAAREALDALGSDARLDPAISEEIGPAPVSGLPREILPEALRLRGPGQRALAEHEGSWWLVELVEVLPAVPRPYQEVRSEVERSLRTIRAQEAYAALLEQLRAQAEIEIDEAVLADDALWAGD
jgi:hypothetical protein